MPVETAPFGEFDGKPVTKFTLSNKSNLRVSLIDYGATLISLKWGDDELTLNYPTLDEIVRLSPYFGSTCGRVANRIANASFELDGTKYTLAANNGTSCLHGGIKNFSKVVWNHSVFERENDVVGVAFTLHSKHLDEGFPGNLESTVEISINGQNELEFSYTAKTDLATPINLTNHTYWNLSGNVKQSIRSHFVKVNADHYTPTNAQQIPTGEIQSVEGTPFDLRSNSKLDDLLDSVQGGSENGFDHNFCVRRTENNNDNNNNENNKHGVVLAAVLHHPESKYQMEVFTSEPGVQVYTYNFGSKDQAKHPYVQHNAVCFETQKFPNAINTPQFGSCVLRPGETYTHHTMHRFSVVD